MIFANGFCKSLKVWFMSKQQQRQKQTFLRKIFNSLLQTDDCFGWFKLSLLQVIYTSVEAHVLFPFFPFSFLPAPPYTQAHFCTLQGRNLDVKQLLPVLIWPLPSKNIILHENTKVDLTFSVLSSKKPHCYRKSILFPVDE